MLTDRLFASLTDSTWQSCLIVLLFGLTLYYLWYEKFGKCSIKTAGIPGYKGWPLVGDCLHLPLDPSDFYQFVLDFLGKRRDEGSAINKIALGPYSIICIHEPEDIERLISSTEFSEKSDDYDVLHKWLGEGLLTSSGAKWHRRRKMLTPSFHFSILSDFLELMNEHVIELRDELRTKLSTFKPGEDDSFDIFHHITLNSLDMICDTAMGVKMHALRDHDSPYVKAVFLVKDKTALRQRTPWQWPDFIYDNLKVGKEVNEAIDYMHQFAERVIRERAELHGEAEKSPSNAKRKRVFLDTLLDCQAAGQNGEIEEILTDKDIREEVDTFMFEGHDTVSSATAHTVHLLGAHPDIQRHCQEELDNVLTAGDVNFSMAHLRKLDYLEACIKESLRLLPSVPWFARKIHTDTEFGGRLVPAESSVVVFANVTHRDPKIYPQPDRFDPERWIDGSKASRHPYSYLPFSAGPRNCIGQKFAMMELKVTVATVLRNFNIQSMQKTKELRPTGQLILQPVNGVLVKLTPRE